MAHGGHLTAHLLSKQHISHCSCLLFLTISKTTNNWLVNLPEKKKYMVDLHHLLKWVSIWISSAFQVLDSLTLHYISGLLSQSLYVLCKLNNLNVFNFFVQNFYFQWEERTLKYPRTFPVSLKICTCGLYKEIEWKGGLGQRNSRQMITQEDVIIVDVLISMSGTGIIGIYYILNQQVNKQINKQEAHGPVMEVCHKNQGYE